MFKRVAWMGTGAALGAVVGAGATVWLDHKARRTVARLAPDSLGRELVEMSSAWGRDLQAAWREGRRAMHERERELRRELIGEEAHRQAEVVLLREGSAGDSAEERDAGRPRRLRLVAGEAARPQAG